MANQIASVIAINKTSSPSDLKGFLSHLTTRNTKNTSIHCFSKLPSSYGISQRRFISSNSINVTRFSHSQIRNYSQKYKTKYEAPTSEKNNVGVKYYYESTLPWWDKIGVNTSLNRKSMENWHDLVMTDEEIEETVRQMPTDLELAGLTQEERSEYLRLRYEAIQESIGRARKARERSPHTFVPITHPMEWEPSVNRIYSHRPKDAPLDYDYLKARMQEPDIVDLDGNGEELESIPPSPLGPHPPPPPLPDVTYWQKRPELVQRSQLDKFFAMSNTLVDSMINKFENEVRESTPWLSSLESVRIQGEKKLRQNPESYQSIKMGSKLHSLIYKLKQEQLRLHQAKSVVETAASAGHARIPWHQITADEWNNMNDVEFAYWRHKMYYDRLASHGSGGHDPTLPGTVTILIRESLQEWQRALYAYENAKRPKHMTTADLSIWQYEIRQTEWNKAGSALERRLRKVEKKAILHRRKAVLQYLDTFLQKWTLYYAKLLENIRVIEKWGNRLMETNPKLQQEAHLLKPRWESAITTIMNILQEQKSNGPFPNLKLEQLDQHSIDKIYRFLIVVETSEVEQQKRPNGQFTLPEDYTLPKELEMCSDSNIALLSSSGDDETSGLFGTKLLDNRKKRVQEESFKTLKELERRKNLVIKYWEDHQITPNDDEENLVKDYKNMPFEFYEMHYLKLLDQGIDVHGLYEAPMWEMDSAGRFKATLEKYDTSDVYPTLSISTLESQENMAYELLQEILVIAFPTVAAKANIKRIPNDFERLRLHMEAHSGLKWDDVFSPGQPEILRAEKEAAFYSIEEEAVDPHQPQWRRILERVWAIRRPPSWLTGRCPEIYEEWVGVTNEDMMASEPRRRAYELAKRSKDFKASLLLQSNQISQEEQSNILKAVSIIASPSKVNQNQSIITSITEVESVKPSEKAQSEWNEYVSYLIPESQRMEAEWIKEYDFLSLHRFVFLAEPTEEMCREYAAFQRRFDLKSLLGCKRFPESPDVIMVLIEYLSSQLKHRIHPKVIMDMEVDLYRHRQRVNSAYEQGTSPEGIVVMRTCLLAHELKKKIELLQESVLSNPSSFDISRRLKTNVHKPKTLASGLFYLVSLPFSLLRTNLTGRLPRVLEESIWSPSTEKKHAITLMSLTRQLEALNQSQPWKMWSSSPWAWERELLDKNSRLEDVNRYESTMNFPRRWFWDKQKKLWEDYVGILLQRFHDLLLQQRAREGVPLDSTFGLSGGEQSYKHFWLGQYYMSVSRIQDAIMSFEAAIRFDNLEAMHTLGMVYTSQAYAKALPELSPEYQFDQPRREQEARKYLEMAGRRGSLEACMTLAYRCINPPPATDAPNPALTVIMLRIAIEEHDSDEARFMLARIYSSGNYPEQLRAIELYKKINTPEAKQLSLKLQLKMAKSNIKYTEASHLVVP